MIGRTSVDRKTISDFGDQWTRYTDNSGYYGSAGLFHDICGPLLAEEDISDKAVADIGAGSGRIVNMLLDAGAANVTAIEPSDAAEVLRTNTAGRAAQVTVIRGEGTSIPQDARFDLVVSIGVLHHIEDPAAVVVAAEKALKPGGKLFIWLYGREGNAFYLALAKPLRTLTKRMPHRALAAFCWGADGLVLGYAFLARHIRLPMRDYLDTVYCRLAPDKRRLVIYDQLNPAYAKYYRREEATRLLEENGFHNVAAYHRHGYSWSVVGEKRQSEAQPSRAFGGQ